MYYHTCSGCKFNRKYINSWENWCHEPTFPTGIIVYTKGGCDKWERGGLVIQPQPQKKHVIPPKRRTIIPPKRRTIGRRYALNKKNTKAFLDKYFSGGR